MIDVFNRILQTKPNTFITFNGSAPVSSGFSPMPYTTTGLTHATTDILPGGLSGVARSTGSITFNGKIANDIANGGSFSVEMIYTTHPDQYGNTVSGSSPVVNVAGVGTVVKTMQGVNYIGSYGTALSTTAGNATSNALSLEMGTVHFVLNVDSSGVSTFINGVEHRVELDGTQDFKNINSVTAYPSGSDLWGVVIRDRPLEKAYIDEISNLVKSYPTAAEADAEFNATSFDFDKVNVEHVAKFRLDDMHFEDNQFSALLYNGSDDPALFMSDEDDHVGTLPAFDGDLVKYAYAEGRGGSVSLLGEDQDSDLETWNKVDLTLSSTTCSPVVSVAPLASSPSKVMFSRTLDETASGGAIGATVTLLPEVVKIRSSSMPDRVATVDTTGAVKALIGQEGRPFNAGGVLGRVYIEPDSQATVSTEYPEAYGMWVHVSRAGALVTSSAINISLSSTLSLTRSGVSSTYVDGVVYSSGNLSRGWHFISFIPTAKSNNRIALGSPASADSNVIGTFSMYYATSPASYMSSVYGNYVNPKSVRPVTSDSLNITEFANRVYAHEWSISSGD